MTDLPDLPKADVLVLLAHPDDEIFFLPIMKKLEEGKSVQFVYSALGEKGHYKAGAPSTKEELIKHREIELLDALNELGIKRSPIVLDIPDSQTSWDISSGEKVIEVNLVTNKDWSVEIDGSASSWISVSPSQGTAGEYTLKISVSENNTENQRNGILTVVCGDERRDIYINQKEKTFQPEGEGPDDMPIEEWK